MDWIFWVLGAIVVAAVIYVGILVIFTVRFAYQFPLPFKYFLRMLLGKDECVVYDEDPETTKES